MASKTNWHSRLDRVRQRFVLTPHEKQVVAFIVAAFLLGLFTKHYRDTHPIAVPASTKAKPAKTIEQRSRNDGVGSRRSKHDGWEAVTP